MVIVACKCLNITVTISSGGSVAEKAFPTDGPVCDSVHTQALQFLKESIGPYKNPTQLLIETKHDELTRCHHIQITPHANTSSQTWALNSCLICEQIVYGSRVDASPKSTDPEHLEVVCNGQLVTSVEAINALKLDEHYSKIFRVVIRPSSASVFSSISSTSPPRTKSLDAPVDLQSSDPQLKNLLSLLNERLRRETERTEETIRQLTADQFVALRVFRQAAEQEFSTLARKLKGQPATAAAQPPRDIALPSLGDRKLISISVVGGSLLLETPPLTPDSGHDMTNSPPVLMENGRGRPLSSHLNPSSLKMPAANRYAQANDYGNGAEEDFFGMDVLLPGALETGPSSFSDYDENCDDDEEDEAQEATEVYRSGRCIPPVYRSLAAESATGEGMVIAKSLPIPTPAMQERITMERTNEESDDNVDIAASIKALAKSVHGSDAIFGDLPRPRLSTQI